MVDGGDVAVDEHELVAGHQRGTVGRLAGGGQHPVRAETEHGVVVETATQHLGALGVEDGVEVDVALPDPQATVLVGTGVRGRVLKERLARDDVDESVIPEGSSDPGIPTRHRVRRVGCPAQVPQVVDVRNRGDVDEGVGVLGPGGVEERHELVAERRRRGHLTFRRPAQVVAAHLDDHVVAARRHGVRLVVGVGHVLAVRRPVVGGGRRVERQQALKHAVEVVGGARRPGVLLLFLTGVEDVARRTGARRDGVPDDDHAVRGTGTSRGRGRDGGCGRSDDNVVVTPRGGHATNTQRGGCQCHRNCPGDNPFRASAHVSPRKRCEAGALPRRRRPES